MHYKATANGDTATVDFVECIHHDELVMVYSFCVMEDHTYFVGEQGVLVHNHCNNPKAKKINDLKKSFIYGKDGEKELAKLVGEKSEFPSLY